MVYAIGNIYRPKDLQDTGCSTKSTGGHDKLTGKNLKFVGTPNYFRA